MLRLACAKRTVLKVAGDVGQYVTLASTGGHSPPGRGSPTAAGALRRATPACSGPPAGPLQRHGHGTGACLPSFSFSTLK